MTKSFPILILFLGLACQVLAQEEAPTDTIVTPVSQPAVVPDPDLPPLVIVTGRGRVRALPDQVQVTVGIEERAKTIDELQDSVDTKSADIISYLQDNGVEDKDIQTSYVNLSPGYSDVGTEYGSTEIDYYTATKSLTVTIRDISSFDSILSGLYKVGVNSVSGISFNVEDLQAQKQEAKKRAVAKAREIANALTEGLNVSVGAVYQVNDQTYDNPVLPIVYAAADSDSQGGDASVAGGEVEITATVSVSFLINN